ncbi:hypothetical protein SISNIDRAFT_351990 [Sistotremastrum niveocremeum HHB9708]|uniref:Hydrophobin n=1 Tax=Sistotremastrum niveocremeum HHB9708 TaxID=1314777 RepID=A0A164X2D7_9AGAM|nr:hypothetical protein SISNIDRAFT_351990 [Sistotremastrum niveocremeum HHB9708]
MFTGSSLHKLLLASVALLGASRALAQSIPANPCTPGAIGVGIDSLVDNSFGIIVDNDCNLVDHVGSSSPPNTGNGGVCGTDWDGHSRRRFRSDLCSE